MNFIVLLHGEKRNCFFQQEIKIQINLWILFIHLPHGITPFVFLVPSSEPCRISLKILLWLATIACGPRKEFLTFFISLSLLFFIEVLVFVVHLESFTFLTFHKEIINSFLRIVIFFMRIAAIITNNMHKELLILLILINNKFQVLDCLFFALPMLDL